MKTTEEIEVIWIPEEETKHSLMVENAQGVNELVDLRRFRCPQVHISTWNHWLNHVSRCRSAFRR